VVMTYKLARVSIDKIPFNFMDYILYLFKNQLVFKSDDTDVVSI